MEGDKVKCAWSKDDLIVFDIAIRLKQALTKKNKTIGHTKCPVCGGWIKAILIPAARGTKHIHMACQTKTCHVRLME